MARVGRERAALDLAHDVGERRVGRGVDAALLASGDDEAVEEVDLGAPSLDHVLRHGRALLGGDALVLRQEPDLEWLLTTPLPTTAPPRKVSIDPKIYQGQIVAAMSVNDDQRKRKCGEVQRRLTAIKTIADEFAAQEHYAAALTIYEVLVTEVIEHFNDYRDEYVAFSVILRGCIDGLDSCFAGEEDNPEMRLRVIRVLFAIYRFYTDSWMDLDEDIPGLLVGNTTLEEHQVIASWLRDALSQTKAEGSAGYSRQRYEAFLAALEQVDRP